MSEQGEKGCFDKTESTSCVFADPEIWESFEKGFIPKNFEDRLQKKTSELFDGSLSNLYIDLHTKDTCQDSVLVDQQLLVFSRIITTKVGKYHMNTYRSISSDVKIGNFSRYWFDDDEINEETFLDILKNQKKPSLKDILVNEAKEERDKHRKEREARYPHILVQNWGSEYGKLNKKQREEAIERLILKHSLSTESNFWVEPISHRDVCAEAQIMNAIKDMSKKDALQADKYLRLKSQKELINYIRKEVIQEQKKELLQAEEKKTTKKTGPFYSITSNQEYWEIDDDLRPLTLIPDYHIVKLLARHARKDFADSQKEDDYNWSTIIMDLDKYSLMDYISDAIQSKILLSKGYLKNYEIKNTFTEVMKDLFFKCKIAEEKGPEIFGKNTNYQADEKLSKIVSNLTKVYTMSDYEEFIFGLEDIQSQIKAALPSLLQDIEEKVTKLEKVIEQKMINLRTNKG